ncbi:hypothetical protein FRC11_000867, partial [Ceratobasidium sp. 423]
MPPPLHPIGLTMPPPLLAAASSLPPPFTATAATAASGTSPITVPLPTPSQLPQTTPGDSDIMRPFAAIAQAHGI